MFIHKKPYHWHGHSASVEDFCILDKVGNELDVLIRESLLILRDHPMLNQENSSLPVCLFLISIVYLRISFSK